MAVARRHARNVAHEVERRVEEMAPVSEQAVVVEHRLRVAHRFFRAIARIEHGHAVVRQCVAADRVAVPALVGRDVAHLLCAELFGILQPLVKALHMADLEDAAALLRECLELKTFLDGDSHRLFQKRSPRR